MKDIRVVVVGFGVIGRGLAETILKKRSLMRQRVGVNLIVPAICEVNGCLMLEKGVDLEKALSASLRELDGWREVKTKDVIREAEADVVVELTPGSIQSGEPGLSHILAALSSGKHVVTSNKAPLAVAYRKIMEEAGRRGRVVRFEATVGGAIPVMNLMEFCLQANEVTHAYGILNGTTNYVLSKMAEDGVPLESALKEAQDLGYAEPDPKYDIEGVDSAVKVVILANALLGKDVSYRDMKVAGIREVTSEAVELAKKSGYVIKLVGDVKRLEVSPRLVPVNHPLNVSGSLNALMLNTDVAGDLTLIGRGAGARETSSSILSDILSIAGRLP